jgi:hypothetical protein
MVVFSLSTLTDLWSEPVSHWLSRYAAILCIADIAFILWICIRHCRDPNTRTDWVWNGKSSRRSRPNLLHLFTFRNMGCHFLGNFMDCLWFHLLAGVNEPGPPLALVGLIFLSIFLLIPRGAAFWFSALLSNKWERDYELDRYGSRRITYDDLREYFVESNWGMKCAFLFWIGFCHIGSFGLWLVVALLSLVFGVIIGCFI